MFFFSKAVRGSVLAEWVALIIPISLLMVLEIMKALPDFCAAVEADSMMLLLDAWDG